MPVMGVIVLAYPRGEKKRYQDWHLYLSLFANLWLKVASVTVNPALERA